MLHTRIPVLGFAGFSGTGKTTLLQRLLPLLSAQGLRIGMVKHAHHNFEVDTPGKDSYELRKAGAAQTLVVSRKRWALMVESEGEGDPSLQDALDKLHQETLDLILVEGFKHEAFPKIELFRPSLGREALYPDDPYIIAIATDGALPMETSLPQLDLNEPAAVATFVRDWLRGRED